MHGPLIEGWLRARGVGADLGIEGLPPTGFVVDRCAAGFLYRTDGCVAYVDSFVTDPEAPKYRRREALRVIMRVLSLEAEVAGFRVIAGATSVSSLVEASVSEGLEVVGSGCTYVARRFPCRG